MTGCSSSTGGTAEPTAPAGGASGSAPSSAGGGAPKVTTPLDTTAFQQNPCSALTPAQLSALAVPGPTSKGTVGLPSQASGPTCDLVMVAGSSVVSAGFLTNYQPGSPKGLAYVYSTGNPPRLPDIEGLPAVLLKDAQGADGCQVDVGTSDDVVYVVGIVSWTASDPCTKVEAIATAALTTMKSAG
ncbi:MAG TPA: DUF3558 domain-containing protein [Pseudonocardiaceae bacterium]|nr:DUF3558 domain-containing protein [Pseudonocardiaceae bacterium]